MFIIPHGKFKRVQSTAAIVSRCHLALGRKPSANVNCAHSYIIEMQCFICVTYMIILCSGNPTKNRDVDNKYDKFSFVNNFIASLFHNHRPEEINDNEENKLTHTTYAYDNYQHLLNEADFLPRRNDRIAMPPLQYRFPKSIKNTFTEEKINEKAKDEMIIVVNGNKSQETENSKKERSRPGGKNKIKQNEEIDDIPDVIPFLTSMAGQSQMGDRESQTVVKPTVIVNIRGSINHRDDTRLDKGKEIANDTDITRNVFNINQEINVNSDTKPAKKLNTVQQNMKAGSETHSDEELLSIICEPNYWKGKNKERKLDVMQILLTV